jgi:uncharacterized protein YneF (UPF0154 family)
MEQKMIMVTVIALAILLIILSFCVGYIKGFKKSKQIDDEIIKKLGERGQ